MVKVFRKTNGDVVDVVQHTLDVLKECPWVDIHIGTDSQNHKRYTTYVIVIAYRYGTRGVHFIYNKARIPKIRDKWTRLWKEAEMTVEVAQWLREQLNVNIQLDLDYNLNSQHFSNGLVSPTNGWATSLGFKVNFKPNSQIATWAADHLCKSGVGRKRLTETTV
jgi:uncharacterized protein